MSLINKVRLLQNGLKAMPKSKNVESYGGLAVRTDLRAGVSRRQTVGASARTGSRRS